MGSSTIFGCLFEKHWAYIFTYIHLFTYIHQYSPIVKKQEDKETRQFGRTAACKEELRRACELSTKKGEWKKKLHELLNL